MLLATSNNSATFLAVQNLSFIYNNGVFVFYVRILKVKKKNQTKKQENQTEENIMLPTLTNVWTNGEITDDEQGNDGDMERFSRQKALEST